MGKATVFFGAAVFVCATLVWDFEARGGDPAEGKALYEQHCTICHGADGKGNGPAAAALNPHPTDFTRPEFWKGESSEKIADVVRNGHGQMPAFKMGATEITDIIDYLEKAFKK